MKALTLKLQDDVHDCLLDLMDKEPSTDLEQAHKSQYGWSDETYQKILSLRQTVLDIGATVSNGSTPVMSGKSVTSLKIFNTKASKEHNEIIALKMCNVLGIRLSHIDLRFRGSSSMDYPHEVIAHFRDPISPAQQRDLLLMVEGHTIN